MNIAVDFGNTTAKVGIFKDDILEDTLFFNESPALKKYLGSVTAENLIVSSVGISAEEILAWSDVTGKKFALGASMPLPITLLYRTPRTLGVDRIAAVCGAQHLYPGEDCLIIDAGTCINYEFLDANSRYHGGAISPGISMRFAAMSQFTARLPVVKPIENVALIGDSTETCMQSGVINGILAEVNGIIQRYKKSYPDIRLLLCGGDAHYFERKVGEIVLVFPDLVLLGLNGILKHSVLP